MLRLIFDKRVNLILIFLYILCNGVLIYYNNYHLLLLPLVLIIIYLFSFHIDIVFLLIVLCTPFSFNFENLELGGIGFYFPTEPLLLLFSIVFLMKIIYQKRKLSSVVHLKHPITLIILIQLLWIFLTCITSEFPYISFKFLIARCWFIIPIFFYAIHFFKEGKHRIIQFLWAFIVPIFFVCLYTLITHYKNDFSEESGHWVMWPFFKDHTSYGAIVAISIPMVFFLLKETKEIYFKYLLILVSIVLFLSLYFSYTRAAWLSIVCAGVVYLLYKYKVKLKWLISFSVISGLIVFLNFSALSYIIEKNDAEHTTENFSERIESMSNISSDASNLERLNRWNCAIKLFEERPVFGWGPGTYSFVYAPYQSSNNLTIISTNFGDAGNAHSEYLGPLSEQGLFGMLIMLILVITIFYISGKFYVNSKAGFERNVCMMIILSLSTYFSHAILNNYLDTDKASIPVWGLIAIFVTINTYKTSNNNQNVHK